MDCIKQNKSTTSDYETPLTTSFRCQRTLFNRFNENCRILNKQRFVDNERQFLQDSVFTNTTTRQNVRCSRFKTIRDCPKKVCLFFQRRLGNTTYRCKGEFQSDCSGIKKPFFSVRVLVIFYKMIDAATWGRLKRILVHT